MIVSFLFWILVAAKLAKGQSTTTVMGARAAGMGQAVAAVSDEWAIINNVGGLGKVNRGVACAAFEVRPHLPGANRTAAALALPSKVGTWALGVFRFGDEIYNEHLVSLGFGNEIGNTALGARVNYIQYRAEGFQSASAISADFGGITQLTPQVQIGAYIINLTQSKLYSVAGAPLPTRLVAGVSYRPDNGVLMVAEMEKDIDYEVTWRSGFEYGLYKKVFFRTGVNLHPDAGYFGVGGIKKNLKLDYAFRFSRWMGAGHQASVVLFLTAQPKK